MKLNVKNTLQHACIQVVQENEMGILGFGIDVTCIPACFIEMPDRALYKVQLLAERFNSEKTEDLPVLNYEALRVKRVPLEYKIYFLSSNFQLASRAFERNSQKAQNALGKLAKEAGMYSEKTPSSDIHQMLKNAWEHVKTASESFALAKQGKPTW